MTREDLIIIGPLLFGSRWQSDLARETGYSDRAVRRWVTGAADLPDALPFKLRRIATLKGRALLKLAAGRALAEGGSR